MEKPASMSILKWHRYLLFFSNLSMISLTSLILLGNDNLNNLLFVVLIIIPILLLLIICLGELYVTDNIKSKEIKSLYLITGFITSTVYIHLNSSNSFNILCFTIFTTLIVFLISIYVLNSILSNKK